MDIRLIRRPHPNRTVRASGITPTDPYLEWCWLPVVGPSTVALVRHAAELTAESCEARMPVEDLSRLLGLGKIAAEPGKHNKLMRTIVRAEQYGLGFANLGVPEGATFGIHDHLALVPARLLGRLPDVALPRHVAAVAAVNETLTAAGLPAFRSPLTSDQWAAERRGAAAESSTPDPAPTRPQGALRAVPPIARLDAQTSASTPPPELSL